MTKTVSGSTSDGYHTFDELYEHRCTLFIALMQSHPQLSWRSRLHSDGTSFDGWFVAGMTLSTGQVTYHLPIGKWSALDDCGVITLPNAPVWDGHTAADVVGRIASHDWRCVHAHG